MYIEQKIYLFLWRPAIFEIQMPKNFWPGGDYWLLKVITLKVKLRSVV